MTDPIGRARRLATPIARTLLAGSMIALMWASAAGGQEGDTPPSSEAPVTTTEAPTSTTEPDAEDASDEETTSEPEVDPEPGEVDPIVWVGAGLVVLVAIVWAIKSRSDDSDSPEPPMTDSANE